MNRSHVAEKFQQSSIGNIRIDADRAIAWSEDYSDAFNTGIRTRYCPAIDIDVYDAEMVKKIRLKISDFVPAGTILERIGQLPKVLIPFHSDVPLTSSRPHSSRPMGRFTRSRCCATDNNLLPTASIPIPESRINGKTTETCHPWLANSYRSWMRLLPIKSSIAPQMSCGRPDGPRLIPEARLKPIKRMAVNPLGRRLL